MGRLLVGIDLGTTNTALAYVDTAQKPGPGAAKLHTFNVPQVVAAGQVGEQPLLPSFLYLPGPHDLAPGSIDLPWKKNPPEGLREIANPSSLFLSERASPVSGTAISAALEGTRPILVELQALAATTTL